MSLKNPPVVCLSLVGFEMTQSERVDRLEGPWLPSWVPSGCIQLLQTTHSTGPVLQNGPFSSESPCCLQPPCSPRLQLFPYGSQSTQTPPGQSCCMSLPVTDGGHAHSRYQSMGTTHTVGTKSLVLFTHLVFAMGRQTQKKLFFLSREF